MATVQKKLVLQVPGSTSNLGPGLDTLALALAIYVRLTFNLLDTDDPHQPFVTWEGSVAAHSLPSDMNNLIYRILSKLWEDDPQLLKRIRVSVDSDIPLGCGLGASAAIILGALWASSFFRDRIPTTSQLLAEASKVEGHAESLAASLMGEFVVCSRSSKSNSLIARQLEWPQAWKPIVVVPKERLQTSTMRSLLPSSVPLADAVKNMQRSSLLVTSVCRMDEQALQESMHDELHENYRSDFLSWLPKLRRLLVNEPIYGCVPSGAGPSILVLVNEKHKERVLAQIRSWSEVETDKLVLLDLEVDREGIKTLLS